MAPGRAARGVRRAPRASVSSTCPRRPTVHWACADVRVRMHGVRGALRGVRPPRRSGRHLSVVRRGEGAEADVGLRVRRHEVAAQVRHGCRRRLLRRLLRLRSLARRAATTLFSRRGGRSRCRSVRLCLSACRCASRSRGSRRSSGAMAGRRRPSGSWCRSRRRHGRHRRTARLCCVGATRRWEAGVAA